MSESASAPQSIPLPMQLQIEHLGKDDPCITDSGEQIVLVIRLMTPEGGLGIGVPVSTMEDIFRHLIGQPTLDGTPPAQKLFIASPVSAIYSDGEFYEMPPAAEQAMADAKANGQSAQVVEMKSAAMENALLKLKREGETA